MADISECKLLSSLQQKIVYQGTNSLKVIEHFRVKRKRLLCVLSSDSMNCHEWKIFSTDEAICFRNFLAMFIRRGPSVFMSPQCWSNGLDSADPWGQRLQVSWCPEVSYRRLEVPWYYDLFTKPVQLRPKNDKAELSRTRTNCLIFFLGWFFFFFKVQCGYH